MGLQHVMPSKQVTDHRRETKRVGGAILTYDRAPRDDSVTADVYPGNEGGFFSGVVEVVKMTVFEHRGGEAGAVGVCAGAECPLVHVFAAVAFQPGPAVVLTAPAETRATTQRQEFDCQKQTTQRIGRRGVAVPPESIK